MCKSINPDKRDEEKEISSEKHEGRLKEMQDEIDKLCDILSEKSENFNPADFINNLLQYIDKYDRLLYANITNYVCTIDEKRAASVQNNVDKVADYIYKNDAEEEVRRVVLKLWDHINLARRQMQLFSENDEKYGEIAARKVEEQIPGLTKEMNVQLISLVAIFTALSFLLFGGISSLDNIFDGAKDIPILKLLIVGNIWCFCIMNLIFAFMFFIAKLTNINIKSTDDVNANYTQKYPFVWWCNWFICSSGVLFGWIYYLKRRQLLCNIEESLQKDKNFFVIFTTILMIVIIFLSGKYIVNNCKAEKNDTK